MTNIYNKLSGNIPARVSLVFIAILIITPQPISAQDITQETSDKIGGGLKFAIHSTKSALAGPASGAMRAMAGPAKQERLNVILELRNEKIDLEKLSSYDASLEARYKNLVSINAPVGNIEDIVEEFDEIQYARLPKKFFPLAVTSEGVNLTGANTFHNLGINGQNVKIAVMDVGFKGLSSAQSSGDLPASLTTRDFTGNGIDTEHKHGTGCAEIVYDMAPGADLYLIKIGDEADIYNAHAYCETEGIRIVSISLGTFDGPGDGTGNICSAIDDAKDAGCLIVASAGNEAVQDSGGTNIGFHWKGAFTDSNSNDIHEFLTGEEDNVVAAAAVTDDDGNPVDGELAVYMRWDDWPGANVDYDLYVYEYPGGGFVASSTGTQNGSQPPEEFVQVNIVSGGGLYKVQMERKSGEPAGTEIELFTGGACAFYPFGGRTSPIATSDSSVMEPATAASALAVGAIDYRNYTTGPQEDFSSQGPTNAWNGNAARVKPDICGPDGTTTMTYGTGNFYGTSASAPHVAAAAALVLSANPNLNVDALRSSLESNAVDMGAAGKDNLYGWGRASLTEAQAYSGVVINEFLPNPTAGNVEWVELYNTGPVALDIGEFYIDDILGGGSSPVQIPNGTTIASGGYYSITVYNGDGYFNNSGDTVNFLMPDGTTVIDSKSYTGTTEGHSYYRSPDGTNWAGSTDSTPTRDGQNDPGAIEGHVYESDGSTPISGVSIGVNDYDTSQFIKSATTDSQGFYLVEGIDAGSYRIMAYPPYGYAPEYYQETNTWSAAAKVDVSTASTTQDIDFTLDAGGEITGYVYKEDGTTPATNMPFTIHASPSDSQWSGFGTGYVDANGKYTIRAAYGGHKLMIRPGGEYIPEYYNLKSTFDGADIVTVSSTQDPGNINFTLKPGATITGMVLNSSHSPVASVELEYTNEEYSMNKTATTDAEGRFLFKGVPSGVAELQAMPDVSSGYSFSLPWPCDHFYFERPLDHSDFTVVIKDGALIRSNVKNTSGVAVGDIEEFMAAGKPGEWWGENEADGSLEFRLPKGDFKLCLWDDSDTYNALPMDISVTDPSATIDLPSDVTVYDSTTGGSIAGDVNNPGSNSKTGSFFVAAFPAGSALDTTTIYSLMHNPTGKFERDSAGPFTLTALPAGTNYDVYLCVFNEFDNGLESIAVRDSDKNIALATTGLDLDYTSQGGSVTGKILDKEGQGITGAYVVFMNETDTEITGFTISEKDGEYEIHNLVAGTHKIHVTHTNYDDLNSPTVVVTNGGIATAGDIVLSSVEQDAIRAAYAAIEAAYQAENLAPLMALFRSDYLHNGKTKALAQQEYQSNFTDLENIDLIVSLPGITINGNNAIVEEDIRLTATVTSTGKPTEIFVKNDLQYWRKDDQDKLWYLYGNQKQFDVAVETMYFHDGNYRVGFYLESPSVDETSVSVNGPNVSNQALAYDSGDDEWHYDADFGTTKPDVGDIYTFTVAGPGGPYTQTEIVSGVVEDFSTLSSPIGGASTGLAPNFNWGAVNGAKYYYIEVFSGSTVNFPEVWSREINGSATSVTFNDDGQASAPLSQNQAYCWRVSACDKKWNSSVTDVAAFNTSTLSVSISPDAWSIGDVAIAEIKTMAGADKITVTNDGQLTSKYSLNAVNPAGWSASTTAAGDETYLVNAAFDSDGAGITWSAANHAISTTAAAATATKFAGDQQGTGVAASQTRRLFLQFHAPTKTAITSQQNIEVIITAEED